MWSDKSSFNAWRTGEAFKEAHGGGSLFGFVTMMVSSTMTLEGPPKPAFWNGLLPLAAPMAESDKPKVVDGWRQVHADGENLLPAECYVTCNRFLVAPGREAEFEERWASRDSKLTEVPGFKVAPLAPVPCPPPSHARGPGVPHGEPSHPAEGGAASCSGSNAAAPQLGIDSRPALTAAPPRCLRRVTAIPSPLSLKGAGTGGGFPPPFLSFPMHSGGLLRPTAEARETTAGDRRESPPPLRAKGDVIWECAELDPPSSPPPRG
eukprot:CAMPEP_0177600964 /NCGR_PEP_ID=MMETSP0419_2-20121207/13965_1 /TAXON_ID=582737 /ORGANISM="Tetraselmis sp., Strain GSL018" /LENGTH=263 /DNA_ID=CAMNT_0019094115 /DNA_START=30 /DNA_END=819 /DNA_ORIENTATION=+